MTDSDLKQIRNVLKEELEPVIDTLDEHTKMLDSIWDQVVELSESSTDVKDTLEFHNKRLVTVENKLDLPTQAK